MRRLLHQLSHWLGLNYGMPVTFLLDEEMMIGFRCTRCGDLMGVIRL